MIGAPGIHAARPAMPLKDDGQPSDLQRHRGGTRRLLLAAALLSAALVAAAPDDWVGRILSAFVTSWDGEPKASEKATKAHAIARLISETAADAATPVLEGDDARARNALLPVSGHPIEAARPFFMPHFSVTQASNAQRCMTQAIYYEAATETDAGKAAVAQVILNRMRHPAYPDTVCGVIYQGSARPGCQFSFACDGSMARAPVPALWRRSSEIARAALAGHVETSIGMATHYHANYVLPHWAPKLAKIDQIDTHIFYRWPGGWGRPAAFTNAYAGSEWVPSFDQLYQGNQSSASAIESAEPRLAAIVRDPTDRRAENDVGGRVDMSKGWTPNIPDPTRTASRLEALTSEQRPATIAVAKHD